MLALQEIKLVDENFPVEAFADKGYHLSVSGQKTYNGVAIISRFPQAEVLKDVSGYMDPQRRILAATIAGIRVINLYVPNGALVGSDKYAYKLHWLEQISSFISQELKTWPKLAVVGDFNIAPEDRDVHDPQEWQGSVLVSPAERQAFADLLSLGLSDSFRLFPQAESAFSWWDYRAAGFRRNRGLRIDHVLLNKELVSVCTASKIDIEPRRAERPSDHAPVWVELELDNK